MQQPEAFSRVLIDRALEDSAWDLLNSQQVQFKHHTPAGSDKYFKMVSNKLVNLLARAI
jgi:hypothetical protein